MATSSLNKVPGERELLAIPRWARVALTARTLRRIQPLLTASWPKATKKYRLAVEGAIAEGEEAATLGRPTPDLRSAGMAAMDVYGDEPIEAVSANYITFAAARVSFAGQHSGVAEAKTGLENARWAVHHFKTSRGTSEFLKPTCEAILSDYRRLKDAAAREKWNDQTSVSPEFFGPMWPKGPPKLWPKMEPPAKAKRSRQIRKAVKLNLPADLTAFLKAESRLEYDVAKSEVGPITLKPLSHLRIDEFSVTTEQTPAARRDPHRGEGGYYALRVVDLVGECDAYGPEGLLAWFCDYGLFGSWDADHHTAIAFSNASWSKIVADPAKYLDAQWNPNGKVAKHIEPWKHCEFNAE